MARNIEIKARIHSVEALAPAVAALTSSGPTQVHQDDTFFRCTQGRIKLRTFSDTSGELIFYQRADQPGPKESNYSVVSTSKPNELCTVLTEAYGQVGRVAKSRTLFMVGRTRVHLDRVEGLGDFLELEIMLDSDECPEAGVQEAFELMNRLGVTQDQLIESAYVDLLTERCSDQVSVADTIAPRKGGPLRG